MNNQPSPQSPRRFMDFAPPRRGNPGVARPQARPQPRPQMVRPTPMSRPVARPAQVSRPTPPRPQTHLVHEHIESTTVYYPSAKSSHLVKEDDFLDIETSGLGIIEDLEPTRPAKDSPDNNNYSLGGQSPFINTDKVDKRPLSSHIPKNKPVKKNIYENKTTDKKSRKSNKLNRTPTVVTGTASRGNSISLVIAIILTVILGALVGTIAYLAFFQ